MNWKKVTKIFTLCLFVVIAVYDAIAISGGDTEASISHLIIVNSYKYPAMTFLFGFVCGHLFWRMRYTPETKEISDATREWGKLK
jgi:hypothetical protein